MPVDQSYSGFKYELRISPKPVAVAVALLGAALIHLGNRQGSAEEQLLQVLLGAAIQLNAVSIWWLDGRQPRISGWLGVLGLVAGVYAVSIRFAVPGGLALLAVPTAVAAGLISPWAAAGIAAGETAIVLMTAPVASASSTVAVVLVAIWSMVGVMVAVYRPVRRVGRWSWECFEQAHREAEEVRDRRGELERTLEDLANANRQLALATERMAALRLVAEEAQKAKAAFVARVSHEFRAPLNMIIGIVGLIIDTPEIYAEELPPDLQLDLDIVHRNCRHLSGMINDVLDLSQAEVGRLVLHKEPADLTEVVKDALDVVRPLIRKKKLRTEVSLPQDLPSVSCDRTRVRQVILNLLSNAARFTEQGGIAVRLAAQNGSVVVSVTDTGPGIPPEDTERLFEPFYQAGGGSAQAQAGSGLGLSVSRQFIELHGGRIWLESEVGRGTTFSFSLPVVPPMDHSARPGHWIRDGWLWHERAFRTERVTSAVELMRPRLVVYDETGGLRQSLARYTDDIEVCYIDALERAALELAQCPAHALILNLEDACDLVAQVDGIQPRIAETPIVACAVPHPAERARAAGAMGYLVKPVSREDVREAIRAAGRPVQEVLIVDDNPDVLHVLARMLRACDSRLFVRTALSGLRGLEDVRRHRPDLVLLDVLLPDMDGWQVLQNIKLDPLTADTPVYFVSAQDPIDRSLESPVMVVTIGGGLSISKLLHCSLDFSALMLNRAQAPGRVPG
jgi:signal transduction histidine kinase/CheY-like chemotaxis protein